MKLLLIGGLGLLVGVVLTIFCFSLAYFFAVNARAADASPNNQRADEKGRENAGAATVTEKKRGVGA